MDEFLKFLNSDQGQIAQKDAHPAALRLAWDASRKAAEDEAAVKIMDALSGHAVEEFEDLHFKPLAAAGGER